MRLLAMALLLVTPALVGCIGDSGTDDPLARAAIPEELLFPTPAAPFTQLLCKGDTLVDLAGDHSADCNMQATTDNGPAAEVHLAVNPLDPMNLVGGSKDFTLGEDARCGVYNVWSGIYWTKDGGRTWDHDLLPGHPGDDRTTALSDYACGSDPVLAFGPDGTVYYNSIHITQDPDDGPPVPALAPATGYPILNSAVAVTRSLDGGETWEDPVILDSIEDGSIIDKNWMAVDPNSGQIYVTYILNGLFYVQRSDDGGLNWTEPIKMFDPRPGVLPISGPQFGQVVVASDGTVHFSYWCNREDATLSGLCHRSSADDGATWSEANDVAWFYPVFDLEVTHKYRIVPNPALAIDPNDDTLYIAYPFYSDREPEDNVRTAIAVADMLPAGLEVLVVASHDGGLTWEDPVKVNDEMIPNPTNGQWMTAIAVGPDSTVHVTWLDYRDDPAGQFAYVYYAYSTDHGFSFSPNARVSDVPFDGEGGYHQSGAGTIGDYMGLAVSELAVHPFWADTRNERNDVFGAIIPA